MIQFRGSVEEGSSNTSNPVSGPQSTAVQTPTVLSSQKVAAQILSASEPGDPAPLPSGHDTTAGPAFEGTEDKVASGHSIFSDVSLGKISIKTSITQEIF